MAAHGFDFAAELDVLFTKFANHVDQLLDLLIAFAGVLGFPRPVGAGIRAGTFMARMITLEIAAHFLNALLGFFDGFGEFAHARVAFAMLAGDVPAFLVQLFKSMM